MCLSRLSVLIACKLCIFVFFPLCFSVFHYLFIRVMFATFCVYFVYDFYANNNKDKYRERTGKELHFHQFPADKKRRNEWIDH